MSVLPTTVPSKTLAQNLSSSGTTLYLNNSLSWDGVQLSSADFGTALYAVLRNAANTQLEIISLDPATVTSANTITILARGLPYNGDTTANTETKYDWPASTTIVELGADTPQLLAQMVDTTGAETIAGVKTFSSIPKTTGGNASDDNELVRYAQALSLLTAGTYSQNRVVITGTAGETLSAGNLVYLKIADGRWWKCDADTAATVENIILGIAQGAGTAGNAVASGVLLFGLDSNQTGLTANTKYYASNTAGGLSTSAGTTEVSIGFTLSTTTIVFWPRYDQQLTATLRAALTPGGVYGTPSSTNPYLTKDLIADTTILKVPTIQTFTQQAATTLGDTTSRFDITHTAGTSRYTYDGTGTDPGITTVTVPTGIVVMIESQSIDDVNTGSFVVTASGTNYFEVFNASGAAENDKTLQAGYLKTIPSQTYTKPTGVKYVVLEVQGAGAAGSGGNGTTNASAGGGGGAYSKKLIAGTSIGATETLYVGIGGVGTASSSAGVLAGGLSKFGSHLTAPGGGTQVSEGYVNGGVASGGDLNINGGTAVNSNVSDGMPGAGGDSFLGHGGGGHITNSPVTGAGYGGGGAGSGLNSAGGAGAPGIIIVTEYYV